MDSVASFQVKNNGDIPVIVIAPVGPPERVLPGKTSPPFTASGKYSIQSEVEKLPLPPPEILVVFSQGGHLDATAINAPSVKVDVITNFDFPKGESDLLAHNTEHSLFLA